MATNRLMPIVWVIVREVGGPIGAFLTVVAIPLALLLGF